MINTTVSIEKQIKELESTLKGDMMQDMETRDKILELKKLATGWQPPSCDTECESCSG